MKDWQELTIARWRCMDGRYRLQLGCRSLSPVEAIREIEYVTPLGLKLIEVEKSYILSLKNICCA